MTQKLRDVFSPELHKEAVSRIAKPREIEFLNRSTHD